MQPEDIIQQKEWHQLTEAEKEIVQPVAANREDYELLRNMLLVALEDKEQTPAIDPSIATFLQTQVQKNNSGKRVATFWYYAAASVVLVIVATWLLMNKPADNNKLVVVPSAEKTNAPDSVKEPVKIPEQTIVETKPLPEQKDVVKKTVPQKKPWREMNTSIAKDTMLLALVTEVY